MYLPSFVRRSPPYLATWQGKSGKSYEFEVTDATYRLRDGPAVAILVEQRANGIAVPLWVGCNTRNATGGWRLEPDVFSMGLGGRKPTHMHVRFETVWDSSRAAEVEDLIAALDPPLNAATHVRAPTETSDVTRPLAQQRQDTERPRPAPVATAGVRDQEIMASSADPSALAHRRQADAREIILPRAVSTSLSSKVGRWWNGSWRVATAGAATIIARRILMAEAKANTVARPTASARVTQSATSAPLGPVPASQRTATAATSRVARSDATEPPEALSAAQELVDARASIVARR